MISFGHLRNILSAIETLRSREKFPAVLVINVWNRFTVKAESRWQDVMLHLLFEEEDVPASERLICEVQFSLMTLTMTRKDLGGHDAYSKFRVAQEVQRYVEANELIREFRLPRYFAPTYTKDKHGWYHQI